LAALIWPAQQQSPSDPAYRISVNLIQVDAVVTDSKGNHIRDLEAADFQIFEDGKPQIITSFSWMGGEPDTVVRGAPILPPDSLRKEDISRSVVLMFDDSGIHAEEYLSPAFPAVKRFITDELGPRDLAAVTASRGGMGIYQQFTNDKQQLLAAIDRLAHRPGFGMWTVDPPLVFNENTGELEPAFIPKPGEITGYRDPNLAPNPIAHLMWAIQGLQKIPGRKSIILFTRWFAAPPSLIDMANRAGVVIHVIYPHSYEGVVPSTAPFRQLAKQTGGMFLISVPGDALVRDLGKVMEDVRGYYLLGYRPDHPDPAPSQGRAARHTIRVRVSRPGLEVRARNGYLGTPNREPALAPKTAAAQLLDAISSPFRAGKIHMRLEPRYHASAPDPKTSQRSPLLRVGLQVDGHDLTLGDAQNGKKKLVYSAVVIVSSQDGAPAASDGRTFSFNLTPEQAAELSGAGVNPSLEVKLPGPGRYEIRAAIRDENSGDTGSAYQYLEVPDFNQPRITLSSIELSSARDAGSAGQTPWSGYRKGQPLLFRCSVSGFRTAAESPHAGLVDAQVILFREDDRRRYSDSGVMAVPAASLAEHYVAGQLDLAKLPPGDYVMQLVARDRLAAPKKQISAQWARFTVSSNQ